MRLCINKSLLEKVAYILGITSASVLFSLPALSSIHPQTASDRLISGPDQVLARADDGDSSDNGATDGNDSGSNDSDGDSDSDSGSNSSSDNGGNGSDRSGDSGEAFGTRGSGQGEGGAPYLRDDSSRDRDSNDREGLFR